MLVKGAPGGQCDPWPSFRRCFLLGAHFTNNFWSQFKFNEKIGLAVISLLAIKFFACNDCTTVMLYEKFYSDHFDTIQMRAKRNFHCLWNVVGKKTYWNGPQVHPNQRLLYISIHTWNMVMLQSWLFWHLFHAHHMGGVDLLCIYTGRGRQWDCGATAVQQNKNTGIQQ